MDAGERPGETGNAIGDDRETERGEARGIAIGADDHGSDLRLKALDDAGEDRPPPKHPQTFVAAAHAARSAAGEQDGGDWLSRAHGGNVGRDFPPRHAEIAQRPRVRRPQARAVLSVTGAASSVAGCLASAYIVSIGSSRSVTSSYSPKPLKRLTKTRP